MSQLLQPKEWKQFVKPGDRIFIGSGPGCPHALVRSLLDRVHSKHFYDLELVHILTLGESPWLDPRYRDSVRVNALFLGEETRKAVQKGEADYTPCFLSEVPSLFTRGILPIDVALVQLSPPDADGYCSLGVTVDIVRSAIESARYVIAQINPNMPRTQGNSRISMDEVDAYMEIPAPITELPKAKLTKETKRIGQYVAMLVEDGATLQMGIGKIPDAVLRALRHHKNLGVHTEMFSDGLMELMQSGVVDNSRKTIHTGKTVTTFCMGSKALYDFVNDNPLIEFYTSDYVNNPATIAQHEHMVAINSALEVDLSGQVVSDSIGNRFYSGIGGQVDFIRGAARSPHGRPIIALPSVTNQGKSRIVPVIAEGAGVVTSRGDVHYVVTEYGIATLRGRSIRERALELIQVAHPDHREMLLQQVRKSYWVPAYQKMAPAPVKGLGDVPVKKFKAKDGLHYFLRPLQPSDERRLQEFFYSHDKETLLLRYHYVPTRMSREGAYSLVNIDQNQDLALCISSRQGPREEIQAVGRYYRMPETATAELAFVVREEKRGQGFGRFLLRRIIRMAKARKLEKLLAVVYADNQPMLTLLEHTGFTVVPGGEEPGSLTLALTLK
ncbi:MAG: GNAT family N-acetyltransferase [Magnetococcales bacterium]|nr:GNAT family N-acetyltransferase [Magnetococcales bacterium]MBF0114184.1 GNAT family N-acetyltransferase [Magnetococcales bacterium]